MLVQPPAELASPLSTASMPASHLCLQFLALRKIAAGQRGHAPLRAARTPGRAARALRRQAEPPGRPAPQAGWRRATSRVPAAREIYGSLVSRTDGLMQELLGSRGQCEAGPAAASGGAARPAINVDRLARPVINTNCQENARGPTRASCQPRPTNGHLPGVPAGLAARQHAAITATRRRRQMSERPMGREWRFHPQFEPASSARSRHCVCTCARWCNACNRCL